MKKFIFTIIALFGILMPTSAWAAEGTVEPYAVLSEDNTTLTFYYDDQKSARNGMGVGPFTQEWDKDKKELVVNSEWYSQRRYITNIVFDISFANCTSITSTSYWFYDFRELQTITDISYLKTDNVTEMIGMFEECRLLTDLNLSSFNTGNVTDMSYMFQGCSLLTTLDVSNFNTANVTNMEEMFGVCEALTDLDLSNFNTANVTNMNGMFSDCFLLTSLNLSNFNTANVTDMSIMFLRCEYLTNLNLSSFNTSKVSEMFAMFHGCSGLTSLDLTSFDTSNVTDMCEMFEGCSNLINLNVSSFNTTNVVNMDRMFKGCSNLTSLDLSNFEINEYLYRLSALFKGCSNLTSLNISGFKTDQITQMDELFSGCSNLANIDVSGFNTANVRNMAGMFSDCSSLTSLDLSGFKTDRLETVAGMFNRCTNLRSINFTDFRTDNVTTMEAMFYGCTSLSRVDLSGFKTDNVERMVSMFEGCSSLESLDLSSFNTSKVTDLVFMFSNCSNLRTVYVGDNWTNAHQIPGGKDGDDTFNGCINIVGGNGTVYDPNHVDYTYARIDKEGEPGYFTLARSSENTEQVATPTFAFEDDAFSISCDTPNASIYYAMATWDDEGKTDSIANALEVNTSSNLYTKPIEITENVVIKMMAAKESMENSEVATFIYNYSAWMMLKEAIEYGNDVYQKAADNPNVDHALVEDLQWAIEEGNMFYRERANMDSFEAEHFAHRISEICATIEEQMNSAVELPQDDDGYYLLGSADDWKAFATLASRNPAANAKMTADIDLGDDQTMIASVDEPEKYYKGHFDGQGHTLNVNYILEYAVAPFRYISNATIENLHVSGRMEASQTSGVGGIVAVVGSENDVATVRNCWSSALLVASTETSDQNTIGGIVSHSYGNVVIEDCLFDGQFGKDNVRYNGGFIANSWGTLTITNSLNVGTYPANEEYVSGTFYRPDQAINDPKLDNVYYKNVCGTPQGEQVSDEQLMNGTVVSLLQNDRTDEIWKQGEEYPVLYYAADSGKKEQVATPTFSFDGDSLVISCATEDALIWYQSAEIDSTFVDEWAQYTAPMFVGDIKINAKATKQGMLDSEIASMVYYYTAWQELIETTYMCDMILSEILQSNPSDNIKAMIDYVYAELAYVRDEYEKRRLEWDRDKIEDEMMKLRYAVSEIEEEWKKESSEATYQNLTLTVGGANTMATALEIVGGRAEVTKDIAAIVWNSTEPLTKSDLEGFDNPNMLIFVNEASMAPEGVENVVIDGKAKSIVLVDADSINNNFYVPQEFTAESISYTREFKQTTQKDVSRGWEGICLPFTVQAYTHEDHGAIAPFRNDASDFHFWLHQMTEDGMAIATNIEANMPYIISMPNNISYPATYNQAGKVTFSAKDVVIPVSAPVMIHLSDGSIGIGGVYNSLPKMEGFYALNVGDDFDGYPEGSVFVNNYRTIRPFEVYSYHARHNARTLTRTISVSSLFGGGDGSTGILDVMDKQESDEVKVYSINGILLKKGNRSEVMNSLPKGLYIIGNQKIMVK